MVMEALACHRGVREALVSEASIQKIRSQKLVLDTNLATIECRKGLLVARYSN